MRKTIVTVFVCMLLAATSRAESPPGKTAAEIDQLIAVLKMPSHEKRTRKAELDEAIRKLGLIGDEAIGPLMAKFNDRHQRFAFRHRAIQVLKEIGTSEAQKNLVDIACGRTVVELPSQKRWAASRYIATLKDKSAARKLLPAADMGVQNVALLALKGQEIDKALLGRLKELLASGYLVVRWVAVAVMAEDPGETLAAEKVSAIVTAMADIRLLPKRRKDVVTFLGLDLDDRERTWSRYLGALVKMRGADVPLKKITPQTSGKVQDAVLVARAARGDRTVIADVRKVLQDPKAGMLRVPAARAMGRIGTDADIPLLRRIARTDPLTRQEHQCMPPCTYTAHPVRRAATHAIAKIEARANDNAKTRETRR